MELAYNYIEKWDEWNPNRKHSSMTIYDDGIAKRDSQNGTNPWIFGTKVISTGITIWTFKIIEPQCYYIGIMDVSEIPLNEINPQLCESNKRCFAIHLYGGILNSSFNAKKWDQ
eukprot:397811_1